MAAVGNKIPHFQAVAGVMAKEGVPAPHVMLAGAIVFRLRKLEAMAIPCLYDEPTGQSQIEPEVRGPDPVSNITGSPSSKSNR
jgi:hypothetical protein